MGTGLPSCASLRGAFTLLCTWRGTVAPGGVQPSDSMEGVLSFAYTNRRTVGSSFYLCDPWPLICKVRKLE